MRYYLSLGSNLGDRQRNLTSAVLELERNKVRIRTISSLYETQPVDVPDQPWFLNRVLRVEAELTPFELLTSPKYQIKSDPERISAGEDLQMRVT